MGQSLPMDLRSRLLASIDDGAGTPERAPICFIANAAIAPQGSRPLEAQIEEQLPWIRADAQP